MKYFKSTLFALLALMSLTSFANPGENVSTEETKIATLEMSGVKSGHQLWIKDASGTVIYQESINQSGLYKKNFDVTALPNGNYFFEIEKDVEIEHIPFKVSNTSVTIDRDARRKIYKPIIKLKENLILISKLSSNNSEMKAEIYYTPVLESIQTSELLHSETFNDTRIISRIYQLDMSKKGTYEVVIQTEGRVFSQKFTL